MDLWKAKFYYWWFARQIDTQLIMRKDGEGKKYNLK
jgi:hypothetical protein